MTYFGLFKAPGKGSIYCPFKDSGSKTHTPSGIGDQSPQILGTWTVDPLGSTYPKGPKYLTIGYGFLY